MSPYQLMQGLILFIALAATQLSNPNISYASASTTSLLRDYVAAEATLVGADVHDSLAILDEESTDCQNMVGDHGTSFGCWQIHLPAHPEITKEQAMDTVWSTEWAMSQLKQGKCSIWSTCPTNATTSPDTGG